MPQFLILFRNDQTGAFNMARTGGRGASDLTSILDAYKGRSGSIYALSGRYDAMLIATFEDDIGPLALALGATANGQYAEVFRMFELDEVDQAAEMIEKAAEPESSEEPGETVSERT